MVNIYPFHCLKMALKTHNNSTFSKKLEIFANSTVDGTQNAFYENSKISQISGFQNYLQTKSKLHNFIHQTPYVVVLRGEGKGSKIANFT